MCKDLNNAVKTDPFYLHLAGGPGPSMLGDFKDEILSLLSREEDYSNVARVCREYNHEVKEFRWPELVLVRKMLDDSRRRPLPEVEAQRHSGWGLCAGLTKG